MAAEAYVWDSQLLEGGTKVLQHPVKVLHAQIVVMYQALMCGRHVAVAAIMAATAQGV